MIGINLTYSCQAHLPRQYASNIEVTDSEPRLSRMCKTSILFAQLAVHVYTDCSVFSVLHYNKTVNTITYKYKTVLFSKLK